MKLSRVTLKGFRNYKHAKINFNDKTLIIGANDVGKTNLFWALRLLLDKGLSEYDVEPKDNDFYAYEETNAFSITLKFENVVEDCVVAKLKEHISDDGKLYLRYKAYRDAETKAKSYSLFAGASIEGLQEIPDRFYRKVLNLRYISCRRDFHSYINKEKHNLLYLAKENRKQEQIDADNILLNEISEDLKDIDAKVPQLNFISSATNSLNTELQKLSIHNKRQNIVFDVGSSNVDNFINNVSIASKSNEKSLLVGGDGRLNQIYLSLWAARNEITDDNPQEVSIVCIEEPEAHLHPHQQRKLSEYLCSAIKSQVIISTHSPQIACEFSPNAIVRLYDKGNGALAASDGCSQIIDAAFQDFGYRLSIIPAEAFFADVVFLVEGPSEELFYKTLAKQLSIDLDRMNISILMVDGIGFKTFINILNNLGIDWVLRTDNDVFKLPKKDKYRFAGVQRAVSFYKMLPKDGETENVITECERLLTGFKEPIPEANQLAVQKIKTILESQRIFISDTDLENDLYGSPIKGALDAFFGGYTIDEDEEGELEEAVDVVSIMQKKKAVFMYRFLKQQKDELGKLSKHSISNPLLKCIEIVKSYQNEAY